MPIRPGRFGKLSYDGLMSRHSSIVAARGQVRKLRRGAAVGVVGCCSRRLVVLSSFVSPLHILGVFLRGSHATTIGTSIGIAAVLALAPVFAAETPKPDTSRGDRMIAEYFRLETQKLQDACLADVKDLADWKAKREDYRRQLLEMLGLDPLPERTDLQATVTGRVEHEEFTVEKLHFQSRPGLYVTGDLYVPRNLQGRARPCCMCAVTERRKRTASALATKSATSITAAGSPGTVTCA